jgi:hypothetical protein
MFVVRSGDDGRLEWGYLAPATTATVAEWAQWWREKCEDWICLYYDGELARESLSEEEAKLIMEEYEQVMRRNAEAPDDEMCAAAKRHVELLTAPSKRPRRR